MAAVSSSQDSSENANSRSVSSDLLSELDLHFCAQDYASYMKVDVSSQVEKKTYTGREISGCSFSKLFFFKTTKSS